MLWIEIGFIIAGIYVVWISSIKYRVPIPTLVPYEKVHEFLGQVIVQNHDELKQLNFHIFKIYDCQMKEDQPFQIAIYIDHKKDIAFAFMGIQEKGIEPKIINEFCSILNPYGELNTNNSDEYNPIYNPKDHLVVKMPWVKSLTELYQHHIEHLRVVSEEKFTSITIDENKVKQKICNDIKRSYEIQVTKKRMKKNQDGSYQFTLWGSILGVPKIAFAMIYPFLNIIIGKFLKVNRLASLRRAAKDARLLPENMRMNNIKT